MILSTQGLRVEKPLQGCVLLIGFKSYVTAASMIACNLSEPLDNAKLAQRFHIALRKDCEALCSDRTTMILHTRGDICFVS